MRMTDGFLKKITDAGSLRPAILAVMVGISLLLSLVFLISPDASSRKLNEVAASVEDSAARMERHDVMLSSKDTFYGTMSLFNLTGSDIIKITRKAKPLYNLASLQADTVLSVFTTEDQLERVEYRFNDFEVLVIEKDDNEEEGYSVSRVELPKEVRTERVSGVIDNSLYEAGLKAGAEPGLIISLSDVFAWDVDFASDIRKGDTFRILYETIYVEGRPVKTGSILGAEITNDGKTFTAVYYEDSKGRGGYYDLDGKSLKRTLLRSPLRYSRISSHFTNRRYHPIHKKYRPHHGIDYAAPTGTPVEAAGSGRVVFAGWKRGYGKYIVIKHNNSYTTAYGHLSRIAKGITSGARVEQGRVIGYVGSTGISTGPHLHYEVRVGNRLINPLSIKPTPTKSIHESELPRFTLVKQEVMGWLSDGEALVMAGSSGEKKGGG